MLMRATTFTRDDLSRAFDEFVTVNGSEKAVAALEEATGVRGLAAVPDHKIVVAMSVLVSRLTLSGPRMAARSRRSGRLGKIHAQLDGMAASIFGPKDEG